MILRMAGPPVVAVVSLRLGDRTKDADIIKPSQGRPAAIQNGN